MPGTLDGKDNYVMAKDRNGRTCLHLASIAGFHNIVYYLLKDIKLVYLVELTDNTDNTALHFAAQHGHLR
jgi:ankyrin repeat protein